MLLVMHCSEYVLGLDSGKTALGAAHGAECTRTRNSAFAGTSWTDLHLVVLFVDAVIVNYSTRIKDVFNEHGRDKDILFSTDYGGNSIINAGEFDNKIVVVSDCSTYHHTSQDNCSQ